MPYWDNVRHRWLAVADAAERAPNNAAAAGRPMPHVTMKPMSVVPLRRPRVPVAVTGLGGAGKTMLYDSLLGKVDLIDYRPKDRSDTVETHRTVIGTDSGKVRVKTIVVPGQWAGPKLDAFRRDFSESRMPSGVIHVVCWGYNRVWESYERQAVLDDLASTRGSGGVNLDVLRARNLDEELEDFRETCVRLKDAWKGRRGVWLIIAVAKCDLFWPGRNLARDYYIPATGRPASESRFCAVLRDLIGYVGEANLQDVAIVPVSCFPETYIFDTGIEQRSDIEPPQISSLVGSLRSVVGEFCAR
jgi:hypothetical protein